MIDSKKIFGDFPPSSNVEGIIFSVAYCIINWPVDVSPVNATFLTNGWVERNLPIFPPAPLIILITPFGNTDWIVSINIKIDIGVADAGFITTQFPAANAGASFQAAINNGKFQGIICATTPYGSWISCEIVFSSKSETVPVSALITDAKYLKWSTTKGTSANRVSLIVLPLSKVSAIANASRFPSIASAILFNKLLLSITEVCLNDWNALSAAKIAVSTSFSFDLGTFVNTFPSTGEILSKYSPLVGAIHSPPMKFSYWAL